MRLRGVPHPDQRPEIHTSAARSSAAVSGRSLSPSSCAARAPESAGSGDRFDLIKRGNAEPNDEELAQWRKAMCQMQQERIGIARAAWALFLSGPEDDSEPYLEGKGAGLAPALKKDQRVNVPVLAERCRKGGGRGLH